MGAGLGRLSCSFGFGRGLIGILIVSWLLILFWLRLTTTSPEHGGVHDGWITFYGLPAIVFHNSYICISRCLWTSYLNGMVRFRPPRQNPGLLKHGGCAQNPTYQGRDGTLVPDDALRAIIPIHNSLEVHVIVAYAPQLAEDLRASLFRCAASLGDVPIIIAADWNVLPENSRAITQALSTGRWVDPAKPLPACGDPRAETAAVAPATHRDGTQGRRADYFLVNKVALPIIEQAFIIQDEPLVNFAAGIRLRAPEALSFASLQPTTTYIKHTPTAEQREAVAQVWSRNYASKCTEWRLHVWTSLLRKHTRRPKGAAPAVEARQLVSPHQHRKATHGCSVTQLQIYVVRLKVLMSDSSKRQQECQQVVNKIRLGLRQRIETVEIPDDFDFSDLPTLSRIVAQLQHVADALVKQRRIEAWQERVTTNITNLCKCVAGSPPSIDVLDTPQGPTSHPQKLAHELLRRSKEQFEKPVDPAKRAEFFDERGHLLTPHPCELPAITGEAIRGILLLKRRAAAGADGWRPNELALLPRQIFDMLAVICNIAEEVGRWPAVLLQGQIIGLPISPEKQRMGASKSGLSAYCHC